jgi:hypothetical protein
MNNQQIKTIKQAVSIVGSLTAPSKLKLIVNDRLQQCYSYSLPAEECNVGSQLVTVKGSTCADCYALKGRYVANAATIKPAQYRRLESIARDDWVPVISFLIDRKCSRLGFFRWHDSGDIQDMSHLIKIVDVAHNLPHIRFWLPTREYRLIAQYQLQHGAFPDNLTVRLSAHMVGATLPAGSLPTSSVVTDGSQTCPASTQGNECRACVNCWNREVQNVSYKWH